ncbi:MAG: hypothetical protein JJ863_05470 [Deltaproteobacteria bacterium]|nr:hypothetical protein [Deltaproteobacteria bacterium]
MAVLDKERGVIVLRVAYDGPPFSGKTTTVRALAEGLGVEVVTPGEANGRTLFFDYADYIGGIFEGRRIRCQIVSVPGQTVLRERRLALLDSADVIVFVADMRESAAEKSFALLEEVREDFLGRSPPVGIILQANKRDAATSLPLASIRARLSDGPVAITQTVATTGEGVRETFVFAIRVALDRVRAIGGTRGLTEQAPAIDDASDLLESIAGLGPGEADHSPGQPVADARSPEPSDEPTPPALGPSEGPALDAEPPKVLPFRPDPAMPGGLLWPPVEGRALLHEVHQLGLVATPTERGSWSASGEGWRFHSRHDALFDTLDAGRRALIEWARSHSALLDELSPDRVLLLSESEGGHRLWQLVRQRLSVAEELSALSGAPDVTPLALSDRLCDVAERLDRCLRRWPDAGLPCTRWTVSLDLHGRTLFAGLMPPPGQTTRRTPEVRSALIRELQALVLMLGDARVDLEVVAALIRQRASSLSTDAPIRLLEEALGEVVAA